MTVLPSHFSPSDSLGRANFAKSDWQSRVDHAVKLIGVLEHQQPSLSAIIFSTLKMALELVNAVSASYAIASNGLCR
jgi:hypothetical protein